LHKRKKISRHVNHLNSSARKKQRQTFQNVQILRTLAPDAARRVGEAPKNEEAEQDVVNISVNLEVKS
jgi:hypothetical protein